jgi:benzodiazapine receptor
MSFLPFLFAVIAAAFTGSRFLPGPWYQTLAKPSWTPPNWLFAPAWTLLYIAMAFAGWLVWRNRGGLSLPLGLWIGQLVLNAAWSWLFFGLHRPVAALADIVGLLVLILAFILTAAPVSRGAALLFVPYGLWVTFATALNASIVRLNPNAS